MFMLPTARATSDVEKQIKSLLCRMLSVMLFPHCCSSWLHVLAHVKKSVIVVQLNPNNCEHYANGVISGSNVAGKNTLLFLLLRFLSATLFRLSVISSERKTTHRDKDVQLGSISPDKDHNSPVTGADSMQEDEAYWTSHFVQISLCAKKP